MSLDERTEPVHQPGHRGERGQTTAEYALMLLAVATIAMLVVAWAGSTGRVGALLDAVFRSVTSMVN